MIPLRFCNLQSVWRWYEKYHGPECGCMDRIHPANTWSPAGAVGGPFFFSLVSVHMVWITSLCVFGFPWEPRRAWVVRRFCVVPAWLFFFTIIFSLSVSSHITAFALWIQREASGDLFIITSYRRLRIILLSFSQLPPMTSPSAFFCSLCASVTPGPFYPHKGDRFEIFILTDYQRGWNVETR